MIGLALSGGGARAMAFHLGCLRAIHDLKILERISVLSTISGGSIIGAYYAYTPNKTFEEFEADIRHFLRRGFQNQILYELLKIQNLIPCIGGSIQSEAHDLISLFRKQSASFRRPLSLLRIYSRKFLVRMPFQT